MLLPFVLALSAQVLPSTAPTRDFAVCRLVFTSDRYEAAGSGWKTDYPLADRNIMIRLGEITSIKVALNEHGHPAHRLIHLGVDDVSLCPILLASDAGTMALTAPEVSALRDYLLRGGFMWSDDTWGILAWEQIEREMGRVLPEARFAAVPDDHAIYRSYYWIEGGMPQISNIGFWKANQGTTSERGAESKTVVVQSLSDDRGRMVMLATHNTDIADTWEQEADPGFFTEFAVRGYGLAVNIVLYALMH